MTASLRTYLPAHDLMAFAGTPVVYHCHHFNLFLDQTIDDALGSVAGQRLRFLAARDAARALLGHLCERRGAMTPDTRLELARETFAAMGHGRLALDGDRRAGSVSGDFLHYGYAWNQKYGGRVRRRHPADAFAAGYAAAAVEVAFGLDPETLFATETECIARGATRCQFKLEPGDSTPAMRPVNELEAAAHVRAGAAGERELEIEELAAGLKQFTAGVAGDERGLVQAFGVFVTMHLAGYYNRISFDALAHVEQQAPALQWQLEELLRESGHVCVFNTFGGMFLSPEWEALVGPPSGAPGEVVAGSLAVARALGFGRWTLHEFVPHERLVVRAPATYESVYFLTRHGLATKPNEYFFQGACLAIAQLAHRVEWQGRPRLTQGLYESLFRGPAQWQVEQTRCTAMGHDVSEVVVSRVR